MRDLSRKYPYQSSNTTFWWTRNLKIWMYLLRLYQRIWLAYFSPWLYLSNAFQKFYYSNPDVYDLDHFIIKLNVLHYFDSSVPFPSERWELFFRITSLVLNGKEEEHTFKRKNVTDFVITFTMISEVMTKGDWCHGNSRDSWMMCYNSLSRNILSKIHAACVIGSSWCAHIILAWV